MRLSFIATLTLIGVTLATPSPDGADKKIPVNAPCKKDGSMGVCENGFCLQDVKADQGVCKPAN